MANSLETTVLRLIGEDVASPDVFTDASGIAQIRASINDAIFELCLAKGIYRRTYTLPLIAERQFYLLAPEFDYFLYPYEVWDRANKRKLHQTDLLTIAKDDPYWMKTTGPAEQYAWVGTKWFVLYRKPDATGRVLELKCACIPKAYTLDTDPIKLPTMDQRAATQLAVSEYFASRGDAAMATEWLNRYLETAQLMNLHPIQPERQWQQQTGKNDPRS